MTTENNTPGTPARQGAPAPRDSSPGADSRQTHAKDSAPAWITAMVVLGMGALSLVDWWGLYVAFQTAFPTLSDPFASAGQDTVAAHAAAESFNAANRAAMAGAVTLGLLVTNWQLGRHLRRKQERTGEFSHWFTAVTVAATLAIAAALFAVRLLNPGVISQGIGGTPVASGGAPAAPSAAGPGLSDYLTSGFIALVFLLSCCWALHLGYTTCSILRERRNHADARTRRAHRSITRALWAWVWLLRLRELSIAEAARAVQIHRSHRERLIDQGESLKQELRHMISRHEAAPGGTSQLLGAGSITPAQRPLTTR